MPTVRHGATRDVITVLVRGWKLVVGFPVAFGLIALLVCLVQTPVYEATVTLYVTSGETQTPTPYEGVMGAAARVASFSKLVYSDEVLARAVKAADLHMTVDQAKNAVHSAITAETVMLTVSATDPNPEVAKRLADAVAHSMMETVTALEVPNGGGTPTSRLTIVTPATVNPQPVSPTTSMDVVLATLGGLVVGLAITLIRERLNNTVRDEQDIEKTVGARLLGRIPHDDVLGAARIIDFGGPATPAAGAFRHLRTVLSAPRSERSLATILVTSPREGEGKSTVAVNLAAAFAESGSSVVLVDAHLGNPAVAPRTGNGDGPGLAEAISSQVPWLQGSGIDGLKVIGAGTMDDTDLADLLASSASGKLFGQLAESFRYVIVDSPSLFDGPDAEAVARWADGVLLVARRGQSKISECCESLTQMSDIGAELVGVVLNDVPPPMGRERPMPIGAFWPRRHRLTLSNRKPAPLHGSPTLRPRPRLPAAKAHE
ncbi:MAG: Wzz/FepE/Etk N-terminal domain-containing protein [Mycobacterium sp.]